MIEAIILPLAMSFFSRGVDKSIGQVRASFSDVILADDTTAVIMIARKKYASTKAICVSGESKDLVVMQTV